MTGICVCICVRMYVLCIYIYVYILGNFYDKFLYNVFNDLQCKLSLSILLPLLYPPTFYLILPSNPLFPFLPPHHICFYIPLSLKSPTQTLAKFPNSMGTSI